MIHARIKICLTAVVLLLGVTTAQVHSEQAPPVPHKPPILTTTAIIEVYNQEEFKGIVLIERGKAPFGKALRRESRIWRDC